MEFIIKPVDDAQDMACRKFITLCWKCSENPAACYEI